MIKYYSLFVIFCSTICFGQNSIDSLITAYNNSVDSNKLDILDQLTRELVNVNHKDQIQYLETYLQLALDQGAYDKAANKSRFLIYQYDRLLEFDESLSLIDTLMSLKSHFKDPASTSHLLLKKGGVYFAKTEFKKASEYYLQSVPNFYKSGDSIFAADAIYFTGQAQFMLGNFDGAIQYFGESVKLYDLLGDEAYSQYSKFEIIKLLKANGLEELALEKLHQLYEECLASENFCLAATALVYIADYKVLNSSIENLDEHFELIKRTSEKCKIQFSTDRNLFYSNIAELRHAINNDNHKEADSLFNTLRVFEEKIGDEYELSYVTNVKLRYYIFKGDLAKSEKLLNEFERLTLDVPYNTIQLDIEKLAAEVYTKTGNPQKANKHYKIFIKKKDSLYNSSTSNAYAYYQTLYETTEKEKEILQQNAAIKHLESENELSKAKTKLTILLGVAILICFILIAYFNFKNIKDKQLKTAANLIKSKKELDVYIKALLSKSEEHDKLAKELEQLKGLVGADQSLTDLEIIAQSKILTKEDWESFRSKFIKVFPNYFRNLTKSGFKFTTSEERLITLEKLQLTTPEISSMLGISVESVNTSRYRLRKKLNAPKDKTIIDFLEN